MNLLPIVPCRGSVLSGLLVALLSPLRAPAQPPVLASAAFDQYTVAVEARLLAQHRSPGLFLPLRPQDRARVLQGEVILEDLNAHPPLPAGQPAGALLSHWRGTAFVAGATAPEFAGVLHRFERYPQVFAPEVLRARARPLGGDGLQVTLRVRQKHVLTVVLDVSYVVSFGQLEPRDGFSASRSTAIDEIEAPDTGQERVLSPAEEHGFLWRLNSYWTFQERDGGLYLQIETVSLSRAIPAGLGWALRPYVVSIPRQSLLFTLSSAMRALRP